MKKVFKYETVLNSNKAETIAEVVVAFLVLSIIMVLFAQGLRYAASAETYSVENTRAYDNAMLELQKTIAGDPTAKGNREKKDSVMFNGKNGNLIVNMYSVPLERDTDVCYYWVFDVEK